MDLRNHSLIKKINRAKILNTIRLDSPIARSHIAQKTGLDKKTMTNFVSEFLKEGLIDEFGKQEQVMGRPFTMLRFRKKLVMGIDIAPDSIRGVLMDLYGKEHAAHEIQHPLYADRKKILNSVKSIYAALKKAGEIYHGVGISMPGILDMARGSVRDSVNMPSLNGMNFMETFSSFISERLFVEETSRCKALAEKWLGAGRGCNDFVIIDIGIGIGSGIISDRCLYKGAGQYAGEIGHVVIEKNGDTCRCGHKGCLEAYLSEKSLLAKFCKAAGRQFNSFEEIDDASVPLLSELIKDSGYRLGNGIAALVNIINPTLIILNGPIISRFSDLMLPEINQGMKDNALKECYSNIRIIVSELGKSTAPGAASLVLSDIFEVPGYYYV
ncbi:MAG: hypothetical protein A2017_03870 [Lentisphaerae bacterium GWF2_44_16]|nr:MAG: hypothetical protein A2017_03870 [Lentisphaerae bacterium GWF2_44_16]